MKYDYAVCIGRFEPFHNAHRAVIEQALKLAAKAVILVGSAGKPRNIRNPWSAGERAVMIRASLPERDARLVIAPLHDHPYSDQAWLAEVQRKLLAQATEDGVAEPRVCLVGHLKDHSSYYLRMFPQWDLVEVSNIGGLSATEVRESFFRAALENDPGHMMLVEGALPPPVFALLKSFRDTPPFDALLQEYAFIRDYRSQFASLKYPVQFITTDAVVVHSGHILLVKRGAQPGKGLLALPGGFVGNEERLFDACLRELLEETRIKLPEKVLRGAVRGNHVFDAPDRSLRGRTVSHAWHFDFPAGELPAVKGGDDAARARWFPLAQFEAMEEQMFEDHFHIANYFLRQV